MYLINVNNSPSPYSIYEFYRIRRPKISLLIVSEPRGINPGEGSSKKNCCWWLTFRQPERKSSSENNVCQAMMLQVWSVETDWSVKPWWYWLKDSWKSLSSVIVQFRSVYCSRLDVRVLLVKLSRSVGRPFVGFVNAVDKSFVRCGWWLTSIMRRLF